MDRVLPGKIEAVLLYDEMVPFQPEDLLPVLNNALARINLPPAFQRIVVEQPPGYLHYSGAGLTVQITQSPDPKAPEGFGGAVASGFTQIVFKEAREVVASHRQHVFISIVAGVPLPDHPLLDEIGYEAETLEAWQFDLALQMMKDLTCAYYSRVPPRAIHWVQSDQMVDAQRFGALAMDENDLSLFVHPGVTWSGKMVGDSQALGFRTYGAQNFIGKEIIFDETHVNFAFCYLRTLMFIAMARTSGTITPHGNTFGTDETEFIRVRHEPDPAGRDPQGIIRLTLERSDAHDFRIDGDSQAEEDDASGFDLNDPVQRAMYERVKQVKAQQDAAPAEGRKTFGKRTSGPSLH
ncbi:MAG: hypothetical protein AAF441_17915 [Pseudomonadota bacterium]